MYFSFIIPVFNRPDEIKELLESLILSNFKYDFEVLIVEDGSTKSCESIVNFYKDKLNISYFFKPNTGPGDSRNFGMNLAKGDYFLLFDSDCIIPYDYLSIVSKQLQFQYVDCFGGPDKALASFSKTQKAINFSMTSFMTTGGIRGGSERISTFEPRSFNMGISKKAFNASGGFANIHPGEDPDLSIRLWRLGFETRLFSDAFVYHKRRIDWDKFYTQVNKFGKVRPILIVRYPECNKLAFYFPSLFILGFFISIFLLIFLQDFLLKIYFTYFLVLFFVASIKNRSVEIGYLAVRATWQQFLGYGLGFLKSFLKVVVLKQKPEIAFPELFFKS